MDSKGSPDEKMPHAATYRANLEHAVRKIVLPRLSRQRLPASGMSAKAVAVEASDPVAPVKLPADPDAVAACDWAALGERLSNALAAGQDHEAEALLRGLRSDGVGVKALLDGLIDPLMMQIGVAWENDALGFAEITLRSGMLQRIVDQLAGEELEALPAAAPTVILCNPIWEQHSFGLFTLRWLLIGDGLRGEFVRSGTPDRVATEAAAHSAVAAALSCGAQRNLQRFFSFTDELRMLLPSATAIHAGGFAFSDKAAQDEAGRRGLTIDGAEGFRAALAGEAKNRTGHCATGR